MGKCKNSIRILKDEIGVNEETAKGMLLMTAALMDLYPEDKRVVEMILRDCGIEYEDIA